MNFVLKSIPFYLYSANLTLYGGYIERDNRDKSPPVGGIGSFYELFQGFIKKHGGFL